MNIGETPPLNYHKVPDAEPGIKTGVATAFSTARDEIDLRQLFMVFWRGKVLIMGLTLIFAVIAGLYMLSLNLRYSASSVVMLEVRERQVTDLQNVVSGLQFDWNLINTEREVLKSRELLGRVAHDLNLTEQLSNPVDEDDAQREPSPFRLSQIREVLKDLPLVGGIFAAPEFEISPVSDEAAHREQAIDYLLAVMNVEPIEESYVFNINVVTVDPGLSARIANAIAEAYVRTQLEVKFDATRDASQWLTARVAELKDGLEAAEARVEDFNSSTTLISEEAQLATARQLKDLRSRAARLAAEIDEGDAERNAVLDALESGDLSVLRTAPTPPPLRSVVSELEAIDASGGSDTRRQVLSKRFEKLISDYLARLDAQTITLKKQLPLVEQSVSEIDTRMEQQSADLVVLRQLRREAEASRLIYEHFLSRMKETSVQQGIQQADSRILSRAVRPLVPSYPRKMRGVMLGAILGLVLGATLVFFRDQLNNTFRRSDEVEAETGLPVLGTIPSAPRRTPRELLDYVIASPASGFAEAVRNVRTALMMVGESANAQVVMTCSSLAAEGKTTVSLMLAQNFSALGRKVLLIEGDVRRRSFGRYFDTSGDVGFLATIEGRATVAEAARLDSTTGLYVLSAEEARPNIADIFASDGFAKMIADAREDFDYVIIDTPPLLLVPDARIISDYSDAVLYVVLWNQTPRELVKQGLNLFRQVGVNVTGVVLSQVNAKRMSGSSYAGDGAYYRSYGKYYKG